MYCTNHTPPSHLDNVPGRGGAVFCALTVVNLGEVSTAALASVTLG